MAGEDIHPANPGARKDWSRTADQISGVLSLIRLLLLEYREDHRGRIGQRLGKGAISGWFRIRTEIDIKCNDFCPPAMKGLDKLSMVQPGPWPGLHFSDALGIDFNNHSLPAGRTI